MRPLAAEPALVGGGEVLEEKGEDHHVEGLTGQALYGAAQVVDVGVDGVRGELQRLRRLQVQKVTMVHGLEANEHYH